MKIKTVLSVLIAGAFAATASAHTSGHSGGGHSGGHVGGCHVSHYSGGHGSFHSGSCYHGSSNYYRGGNYYTGGGYRGGNGYTGNYYAGTAGYGCYGGYYPSASISYSTVGSSACLPYNPGNFSHPWYYQGRTWVWNGFKYVPVGKEHAGGRRGLVGPRRHRHNRVMVAVR